MEKKSQGGREVFFRTKTGIYEGGTFGAGNSFVNNSQAGAQLKDPTLPGVILDYSEVEFLLADAVERGFNVGGTAEEHYNNAIAASIMFWGGTQKEVDDYLIQPEVAYSTAEGPWEQKIGLQKWLALYNRGFEAWSTWRLYDYPELNEAAQAGTTPPLRYTYPVTEYSLNGVSVREAADEIGGDQLMTPVFWDVEQ